MSLNSNNQLKFKEGSTTEPLTVKAAGLEELEFGSKYVVHIGNTIEGYDHFLPSDGLVKKIKEENVDVGDKITIEKVAPSEKYQYGYFNVTVVDKGKGPNVVPQTHKSVEKFEKQFQAVDDKLGLHELTLRVEKLEKIEETRSSEAGHKPGDEKLLF